MLYCKMNRAVTLVLSVLWLQLYYGLIPTWWHGEYYGYGWFVPPIALAFAWRRWQMWKEESQNRKLEIRDLNDLSIIGGGMFLVILILPLRFVEDVDPTWRPPLIFHALLVCIITHGILLRLGGRKMCYTFLPVTIFALSAVPLPWQIEQGIVRRLTGSVMHLTREVFLLQGEPVDLVGDRLLRGNDLVEVTEGCSGIRSLQSLAMAALFFGELLLLGLARRGVLLFVGGLCAVVINTARAWWLAELHFSAGREAASNAHDAVGHLAFGVSAIILFFSALLLRPRIKRKLKVSRTIIQESEYQNQ